LKRRPEAPALFAEVPGPHRRRTLAAAFRSRLEGTMILHPESAAAGAPSASSHFRTASGAPS